MEFIYTLQVINRLTCSKEGPRIDIIIKGSPKLIDSLTGETGRRIAMSPVQPGRHRKFKAALGNIWEIFLKKKKCFVDFIFRYFKIITEQFGLVKPILPSKGLIT